MTTSSSARIWSPQSTPVAEEKVNQTSILSFRTYKVQRMIDVHVATMALQSEEMYPRIDTVTRSHLSTIVSELGTNIIKYAGTGRILLRTLRTNKKAGIEIISVDDGPGIPDLEKALQDHYTTGKTLGLGLGAVRRLATEFDLSCPESGGTKVRAVCWWSINTEKASESTRRSTSWRSRLDQEKSRRITDPQVPTNPPCQLQLTSISRNRPALGEKNSGDALVKLDHGNLSVRIVLDGAGHGPIAHQLSNRAAKVIRQHLANEIECLPLFDTGLVNMDCTRIDKLMLDTASATHDQIRGSRGVAFGMAVFDRHEYRLHYLGIGNTRIVNLNWKGWEGVNRDGQVGVRYKDPVVNHYPLAVGDLVIQCSDGIRSSTLREIRCKRPGATLEPAKVLENLLRNTTFIDDVSILLTRCHD